jgi:guanylate kinase
MPQDLLLDFTQLKRKQTVLFCLCGPTASGKSSIARALLRQLPQLGLSISTTTRPPRPGEEDGREYYFIDRAEFQRRVDGGAFIEHAEFSGNRYGTEHENIDRQEQEGIDLLFDIEIEGVRQLKHRYPRRVVTIFVVPPSVHILEERLKLRGAESEEQMQARLKRAEEEIRVLTSPGFSDYFVVNDTLETAVNRISSIILAERLRFERFL